MRNVYHQVYMHLFCDGALMQHSEKIYARTDDHTLVHYDIAYTVHLLTTNAFNKQGLTTIP